MCTWPWRSTVIDVALSNDVKVFNVALRDFGTPSEEALDGQDSSRDFAAPSTASSMASASGA
eukprot:CAMPEP_0204607438 /NCGR_PEP_ID=MMETSP0661-20131031/59713_1 /ASSEMBLY_ACC=CAM_ASM_000606 /TAXON_ID=109239 /ORGANISM="Alexandrium margalefi, Strain AMGDE01CS-322" /LENGTH=61 /DNA_ID=CAMNT_0051618851 /DNA_START=514 /DNA_END=699 /DNA_ORIENTATION=+